MRELYSLFSNSSKSTWFISGSHSYENTAEENKLELSCMETMRNDLTYKSHMFTYQVNCIPNQTANEVSPSTGNCKYLF